jgi:hypothetical protein
MPFRILLITPKFYGIEKKIKMILENSEHEVIWIENKVLPLDYHGTNSKFKLLRKIYFFLFFPDKRYVRHELGKIDNLKFDILFSINCHIICPCLFRILREKNPGLFSILYLWDSSQMYTWEKELKYFNRVCTFDPVDSERYKIELKHNFFIKSPQDIRQKPENDLFFIGKFSYSRYQIVRKLIEQAASAGIGFKVKLWPARKNVIHNRLIYTIFILTRIKGNWIQEYLLNYEAFEKVLSKDILISESVNYEVVQDEMRESNVILDLPFQGQSGYTHRLIEALANGKKVITTNKDILKENFYNSEQIKIINVLNPEIDISWIRKKSVFPVPDFFMSLEISAWLNSLIEQPLA